MTIPQQLYKYRMFNVNTLSTLCARQVYFARPHTFNDPLDSTPTITMDVDAKVAEVLLEKFGGPRRVKSSSPSGSLPRSKAISPSRQARRIAKGFTPEIERVARLERIASEVSANLRSTYVDWGVLSLAEHWDCPLMWSHYADQHRGLCIEYDYSDAAFSSLKKVEYTDERGITASELLAAPSTSESSKYWKKLFYTKAPQWSYEREWRDISEVSGLHPSFARVSSVLFGLRCDPAVIATVMRLLSEIDGSITFKQVAAINGRFQLCAAPLNSKKFFADNLVGNQIYDFADYMRLEGKLGTWTLKRR